MFKTQLLPREATTVNAADIPKNTPFYGELNATYRGVFVRTYDRLILLGPSNSATWSDLTVLTIKEFRVLKNPRIIEEGA